jgi:hypothetical protein
MGMKVRDKKYRPDRSLIWTHYERRDTMFIQSKTTVRFVTAIFLLLSAVTFVLMADDLFAQRRDRGRDNAPRVVRQRERIRVTRPRFTRERHVVPHLPRGYKRFWHGNVPYFFFGGTFYSHGPSGFISVMAPLGIIVDSIPAGYIRIQVGGVAYYSYGGIFYRRVPYGYVVVAPPPDVEVVEDAPDIVNPPEAAAGKASVTVPILNVRSGPGADHPIIYQIHKGYILDIHGKSDGWLYVELPNGEFGWVMSEFTHQLEEPGSG